MKKFASILDYSYPFLDPAVWDHDRKLFAYQKDFILRLIDKMNETYNLKQPEIWIEDIVILGSLTTSKWLLSSDMDVHIRVNLDAFIASNMPGSTKEQAFEKLDLTRKEFDRAKILAPMTQHPTEFYFESVEFKPSNIALVGVYSLMQDAWLKEPVIFEADLDFEESKKDVVAQAEALAEELDGSLGKIQRDIQRVNELEEVIKAWGHDKQQLFYAKVEAKLAAIEAEILKDLQIKQELVDARHSNQDAMSEIEVKFKWLARFGFFGILSNLKTLLEQTGGTVTTQELPLIEKIISQGSLGSAGQWWFDPSAKLYKVDLPSHNHTEWIQQNAGMENINQAIEKGWIRSRKDGDKAVIHLESLQNIPDFIYDFILKLDADITFIEDIHDNYVKLFREDIIELGPQKAVNKALSQKRMGSIKKKAEVVEIATTYSRGEFPVLIDPTEDEQQELIKKSEYTELRYLEGSNGNVYVWDAYRSTHAEVAKELHYRGFDVDENSIRGTISEDRGPTWPEEEEALGSIKEAILSGKYFIDPNGKEIPLKGKDHGVWIIKNRELLEKNYGIPYNNSDWFKIIQKMIAQGWIRITTSDEAQDASFGIDLYSFKNIPSSVDNFIAKHFNLGIDSIYVSDAGENSVIIYDPFPTLQKAVNKALSQKRMGSIKEAGQVIDVNGAKVFKNPSFDQVTKIFNNSTDLAVRYIIDPTTNDLFIWDAYNSHHMGVMEALGIEYTQETYDNFTGTISSDDDIESLFIFWQEGGGDLKVASIKEAILDQKYWIAPDGKSFPAGDVHIDFILDHPEILDKYGFDMEPLNQALKEQSNWEDESYKLMEQMHELGWIDVTTDTQRGSFGEAFGIRVPDIRHIPSTVDQFISEHPPTEDQGLYIEDGKEYVQVNGDDAVSKGIQKAVNIALQHKRLQPVGSIKEAFLREVFGGETKETDTQIAIDFDGTIAKDKKFPDIGEPEEGVKEALSKIKDLGYDILIYTCRSKDKEELEVVREWLDKHEIPYDSIFEGEKPFAKFYIDDRAIEFKGNWNNVLKQVEKTEKKASLAIVAAPVNLPVIDPKTFKRKEPYALFIGTGDYGSAGKIDMFNVYGEHPMITKSNALPTVTLDTLIQNNIPVIGKEPRAGDKQLFQDISGIVKKAIGSPSAWIMDPNGKLYPAINNDHQETIDALAKKGIKFSFANGWSTVRQIGNNVAFAVGKLNSIPNAVQNYLDEHNFNNVEIIPEDANLEGLSQPPTVKHKDITFGRLQKEVNRNIMMQRRMMDDKTSEGQTSIDKKAGYAHAYWLDPNGKIYPVRGEDEDAARRDLDRSDQNTHSGWILRHLDLLEKEYGIAQNSISGSTRSLVELGWTRIGDAYGTDWGIDVSNTDNIPSFIDDAIAQFAPEGSMITVAGPGSSRYQHSQSGYTFEWPVKSIQQTVQQLKNRQSRTKSPELQQAAKAISKKDIVAVKSSAWLMDPKGKLYPVVEDDHEATAQKLFHKSVYDLLPLGWTTVRTIGNNVAIAVNKLNRIPSTVDDFLAKSNVKTIAIIPADDNLEGLPEPPSVDYEDAIEHGIQKAVNRDIMRMRNMPSLASLKIESTLKIVIVKETSDKADLEFNLNGKKIGYAIVGWEPNFDKNQEYRNLYLEYIEISSEFQNKGYGKEAYNLIQGYAKQKGLNQVSLSAYEGDTQAFWKHMGFEQADSPTNFNKRISNKDASLNKKARENAAWIDPQGTIYDLQGELGGGGYETHGDWVENNTQFLQKNYGIKVKIQPNRDQIDNYYEQLVNPLIEQGWSRIGDTSQGSGYGVQVQNLRKINPAVFDFILQHEVNPDAEITFEDLGGKYVAVLGDELIGNGQKAVNMALRSYASKSFSKHDIIAKTKKVKQGDYSCLMALVPHDLAQEIVEWGVRNVPDEDLYLDEDGKLGRELESHITIKYGLLTNNAKHVRRSFNDDKPFHAKLGKVRHFQPPELPFDVLTVEVISEDLQKANKKVCDSFECTEGLVSDEYKPHITIAYMKRDKAHEYVGFEGFDGKEVELDTVIFSPHKGNRTYFSISNDKESSFILKEINKTASGNNFLPSLFNDTNNEWQFEHGGDDQEIDLQPDSVSDETTWYAPCTEGKPRTKEVWRQFMSMFRNPFSKKEEMTIDSAYDPELEQKEKDALGEDETLLEYSKGFYDPKKHDFPRNTQWFQNYQGVQEPDKVTPVTYSPEMNPEFDKQNSPGGFPNRFCRKPESEWFSDEGEIVPALKNMWKYRNAAIDNMTRDITANSTGVGGWISPEGKSYNIPDHISFILKNPKLFGYTINQLDTLKKADDAMKQAIENGWIRWRIWDTRLIIQTNSYSNARKAENYIYEWVHDVDQVIVQTFPDNHMYEADADSFIETGWGAFVKTASKKEASIEEIDGLPVLVNPSEQELMGFSRNLKAGHMFRGLLDPHTGDLFAWDAYEAIHQYMIPKLGLNVRYSDESPYCLYFPPSSIGDTLERQQEVKQGKIPRSSSLKQAGSYSSTYTDEQGEEMYNEQHMNDTDEEPYVNHDQRDYPYGMHDSPENTGYNIGWPKDNQPYVVRLDVLEDAFYRTDPFGIGEYNCTWYESLPASDGIEQGNPE